MLGAILADKPHLRIFDILVYPYLYFLLLWKFSTSFFNLYSSSLHNTFNIHCTSACPRCSVVSSLFFQPLRGLALCHTASTMQLGTRLNKAKKPSNILTFHR
ncbi:MAG: hypothetical protein CSA32_04545 [Desulfobulbus propionicus]|nr:MAG: hypothetical protein CSA32_04545 [Desulfobulbus propionicus]